MFNSKDAMPHKILLQLFFNSIITLTQALKSSSICSCLKWWEKHQDYKKRKSQTFINDIWKCPLLHKALNYLQMPNWDYVPFILQIMLSEKMMVSLQFPLLLNAASLHYH